MASASFATSCYDQTADGFHGAGYVRSSSESCEMRSRGMGRLLKTELYFANGSSEVWVVYPKTRKVLVHRADRNIQTVSAGELCSD